MTNDVRSEAERIVAEYDRRARELPSDFYALHRPANLFIHQGHEEALLWGLRQLGAAPVGNRRVLDVGCWQGDWLGVFERFGAAREKLAGLELVPSCATRAAGDFPEADVRCGDAAQMPWPNGHFDLVFQRMMVSSILDRSAAQSAVGEMLRVLRPGGAILWLEFAYNNPRNSQVRGIPPRALRTLFPNCRIRWRRVTLAPPLARRIVPISANLARLLEGLRVFNTHYLAVIQPLVR